MFFKKAIEMLTVFLVLAVATAPLAIQQGSTEGMEWLPPKTIMTYPWPTFMHDLRHTGYTESPVPKTNHTLWKVNAEGRFSVAKLSIIDGVVYGGAGRYLVVWDAETGEVVMHSEKLHAPLFYTDFATDQDHVYFNDGRGDLPTQTLSGGGHMYAVSKFTGTIDWEFPLADAWWGPIYDPIRDVIIVGSTSHNYVWGVKNQPSETAPYTIIWFANLTAYSGDWGTYGVLSNPALADGKVYISSSDGWIYCLDQEDGSLIWRYKVEFMYTSPTVVDGKVYQGDFTGNFYCLDAATGDRIWRYTLPSTTGTTAAYAYDKVYVGSYDNNFYALDGETGDLEWTFAGKDAFYGSPAVSHGVVLAPCNDNNLYALDAETGDLIWSYETEGDIGAVAIASADGINGRVYASVTPRQTAGANDPDPYGYVYCWGSGPTAISVSVTSTSVDLGKSTTLYGQLTDRSPASLGHLIAGVPIILSYAEDESWTDFATVTTDSHGSFRYEWTPTKEGTYTVFARFDGNNAYEPSNQPTAMVQVGPAPPEFPEIPDVPTSEEVAQEVLDQLPEYTMMSIIIAVAVVIAILIGLYNTWAVRKLRK